MRKDTVVVVFDFAEEARCETAQSFLPQLPVRNRLRVLLHQALLPDRVRACWSERTCNTKATTINIHVNNTTAFNFLAFSTFRQGALVFATSTQLDCSFLLDAFQLFYNRSFYHDLTSSQLFGKPWYIKFRESDTHVFYLLCRHIGYILCQPIQQLSLPPWHLVTQACVFDLEWWGNSNIALDACSRLHGAKVSCCNENWKHGDGWTSVTRHDRRDDILSIYW